MQYEEVITYLYNSIPNYHKYGAADFKPGLEKIQEVLDVIGNPEKELRFIHIAGTNGKGSTCNFLSQFLIRSGYKTGLFTSPHLFDFRERIQINNQLISKDFIIEFFEKYKADFDPLQPSFFELTFALCLEYFKSEKVDICVIETGLGGRLDATNIIKPDICGITNISLEHTEFLGDSIEKIAFEKGGIIKEETPVVLGDMDPEAEEMLFEIADERNAPLVKLNYYKEEFFGYQQDNLNLAKTILETLKMKGWSAIDLEHKIDEFQIPGRLHKIHSKPDIILDVAHNVAGFQKLFAQKDIIQAKNLHILFGGTKEKNLDEILQTFPVNAKVYFASFSNKRSLTKEDFEKQSTCRSYTYFETPEFAYNEIEPNLTESDTLLICGSFYLLADLKPLLDLQS
ncbi:MAG: folylpolyglutamate synthase/dihydrofolate synthase family protein [Crocinitomicaceae bacterium]